MIEAKLSLTLNSGSAVYTIYDTCLSNFALEGLEQSLFCGESGEGVKGIILHFIPHSSFFSCPVGAGST